MLKRDRVVVAFIGLSAGLASLSVIAAVVSVVREGLGANGAAWAQAAGSIAAIAGAVWLFRSEAVRRRHERRVAGEEAAWAVRFAITNAQFEAQTIAREVISEDVVGKDSPRRHWLLRSENCRNVLGVYARRTDHIHPILNQVASNGMLLLRQMDEAISQAANSIENGERPSIEIASRVAQYEGIFEELRQLLDARMRGILIALDEGRDALPVSQFEYWKTPADAARESKRSIRARLAERFLKFSKARKLTDP